MKTRGEEVSLEEFNEFLQSYPRQLVKDICGISYPEFVGYYDFSKGPGPDAIVASYHLYPNPADRKYLIHR